MGLEPVAFFFKDVSPDACIRLLSAFFSQAAICTKALSRHLLSSQPPGTGIDSCSFNSKSQRLHVENCGIGMQQWSRGLLNLVDNPLSSTGFENHGAGVRYFK